MLIELQDTTSSIEWNITPSPDLSVSYETASSLYPSSRLDGKTFLKLVRNFAPKTIKGRNNLITLSDRTESRVSRRTLDGVDKETVMEVTDSAIKGGWVTGFCLGKKFISAVFIKPDKYEFMTYTPEDETTIFFNASKSQGSIKPMGSFTIRGLDILNIRRQLQKSGISIQKLREETQLKTEVFGLIKAAPAPTS